MRKCTIQKKDMTCFSASTLPVVSLVLSGHARSRSSHVRTLGTDFIFYVVAVDGEVVAHYVRFFSQMMYCYSSNTMIQNRGL